MTATTSTPLVRTQAQNARRFKWSVLTPLILVFAFVLMPVLFVQLLVIELALLAVLGFVDNWFSLRRQAQGPEER